MQKKLCKLKRKPFFTQLYKLKLGPERKIRKLTCPIHIIYELSNFREKANKASPFKCLGFTWFLPFKLIQQVWSLKLKANGFPILFILVLKKVDRKRALLAPGHTVASYTRSESARLTKIHAEPWNKLFRVTWFFYAGSQSTYGKQHWHDTTPKTTQFLGPLDQDKKQQFVASPNGFRSHSECISIAFWMHLNGHGFERVRVCINIA